MKLPVFFHSSSSSSSLLRTCYSLQFLGHPSTFSLTFCMALWNLIFTSGTAKKPAEQLRFYFYFPWSCFGGGQFEGAFTPNASPFWVKRQGKQLLRCHSSFVTGCSHQKRTNTLCCNIVQLEAFLRLVSSTLVPTLCLTSMLAAFYLQWGVSSS